MPRTGDDLAASATGSDPDGHAVTYTYQWLRDGVEHATGSVLDAEMTRNGQAWTLRVTPHDGHDAGTLVEQAILIANTAPAIHGVDVMPETPHAGEPVTLSLDALDVDGDALTVTWSLPSGSTTGMTIDEAFPEAGTYVVAYHVTDGLDAQHGSVEIHVLEAPPVVIHGAWIATEAAGGLEAVVDATGPTGMQLTYQWWHNGVLMEVDGPVLDAELVALDEWMVQVTASFGEDSVARAAWLTVPNHRPLAEVAIAPHWPQAGDDLVATAQTSDPDGHAVSVQWAWSRNGVAQGVVGDTVPGDLVRKGDTWRARAIPHDGHEYGVSGEASVVIQNTPPVVDGVSVAPAHAAVGQSVALSLSASDVDGDDWTVTWLLPDGAKTGDRIEVAFLEAGSHEVYYEVSDGTGGVMGSLVIEVAGGMSQVSSGGAAPAASPAGAEQVRASGAVVWDRPTDQGVAGGDQAEAADTVLADQGGAGRAHGVSTAAGGQEAPGAASGKATGPETPAGGQDRGVESGPVAHHVAVVVMAAAGLALLALLAVQVVRRRL